MEGKCVLKPHFWFSFPKRAPSQDELWIWKNTQIMHFLFFPPHIENSIHCSPVSSPSTIRPLSLRLGKGLWHNHSKGNVLTVPLIRQQRVIVIKETLRAKLWPLPQAHLLCLEHRPGDGKDRVPAQQGLAVRAQGIWSLGFGDGESWVWVKILSQNLWPVTN